MRPILKRLFDTITGWMRCRDCGHALPNRACRTCYRTWGEDD